MVAKRVYGLLIIIVAGLLVLTGCGNKKERGLLPREKTLYISGFLWGPPSTFNALSDDPSFPNTGYCNLVYECMFGYNSLTGELEGILAKEYMISEDLVTVQLNENARWHNGDPVTSKDVVYTFELQKTYPTTMETYWQFISEITAVDTYVVTFKLSEKKFNPLALKDFISSTYIIPEKIYKDVEDKAIAAVKAVTDSGEPDPAAILEKILEFKDDKPIGSGPYTIDSYSEQQVILKRVDSYWGTVMHDGQLPLPVYIVHPIYESNDAGNLALVQGELDVSQNFIAQIWNKFSKGVGTWYKERPYYIPGTIPCMLMCLLEEPFNDVNFRRAVAHAVDYSQILDLSMYGYAPALQSGLVLPFGSEEQFFNKEDVTKYGVSFDPANARKILQAAGYSWAADSMLVDPKGNKIRTLYATCPAGWTDWESAVRIFVKGLRAIGIDVREKLIDYSIYEADLNNGTFDFTMYTPLDYQTASLPWARFQAVMSSDEWAPKGETMYQNQGRYKNPEADSLLEVIPKLADDHEITAAYGKLNNLFMKELPVIPLMYRPWFFYEFSTKHWTNFPTSDNPYSPPQCCVVGAGITALWHITPTGK